MYMFIQNSDPVTWSEYQAIKKTLTDIMHFCDNDHTQVFTVWDTLHKSSVFKMSNSDLESNCLTVWWYTFQLETISDLCFVVNYGKKWPNQQS